MSGQKRTPRAVVVALEQIGDNIRQWRTLNERTMEETARMAGVSVSTLHRLERGEGASLENLLRIARTIPCMDDLVDATDAMRSERGRALINYKLRSPKR